MDTNVTFAILCSLVALPLIVIAINDRRDKKVVRQSSKKYFYAERLYNRLNIEQLSRSYAFTRSLKSKAQLNRMNLERQLISIIAENSKIKELICAGIRNNDRLKGYVEQMKNYRHPSVDDAMQLTIPIERYTKIEDSLVSSFEKQLQKSIPQYYFNFTYTSPKGRNSYRRTEIVTIETLSYIISLVNELSEYQKTAQYQRSLMSASLRYDIMQRDGFRCTLCGRSAKNGVQLHVDHIRPIAKGGKTEWNNLRTLCQECNLGKKDKFSQTKAN